MAFLVKRGIFVRRAGHSQGRAWSHHNASEQSIATEGKDLHISRQHCARTLRQQDELVQAALLWTRLPNQDRNWPLRASQAHGRGHNGHVVRLIHPRQLPERHDRAHWRVSHRFGC